MTLSVVVPCWNERENLPLILARFREVLDRDDVEVILVDNGSSYPFARSVRVDVNRGYGAGILAGLRAATGEWLGWTHADMQTDPRDVLVALRRIEASPDPRRTYAKGDRKGRPAGAVAFTAGMALFESVFLGAFLRDINAQPNVFHRSFLESWRDPPGDFSLDLYALVLARRQGLRVVRFPIRFPERIRGASTWNSGWRARARFIRRTLAFSVELRRRLRRG